MKKLTLILVAGLLLFGASSAFAEEFELGIGLTPIQNPPNLGEGEKLPIYPSFHFGYSWWAIFYTSWDAQVLPPHIVESMTQDFVNGEPVAGSFYPGYLNFFDVGLRLSIGPVVALAETGLNHLYVFGSGDKVDDPKVERGSGFKGTNLRVGAGMKFNDTWGALLTGTAFFRDFQQVGTTLSALFGQEGNLEQKVAFDNLKEKLFPSLLITLYLQ